MILPAAAALRRVALMLDGRTLDQFIQMELTHDLSELCASFQFVFRDETRSLGTWDYATPVAGEGPLDWGAKCQITIDGEPWLNGWVDDVLPEAGKIANSVTIVGRDFACDLVDCPPDPRGKHEYRDITLTEFAEKICKPFGVKVRAEVDVSPKFDKCVVEAGETVMSAIAKYAKQRGVLVTSDRIDTIVITRSGLERAADGVRFPGNVVRGRGSFSARERFSHYFVKGQSEKNGGKRSKTPALDATSEPLESAPEQPAPATDAPEDVAEGAGALVMGLAEDKEVTRWRPHISMARTKATAFDAQRQAEWEMRTRRGKGDKEDYAYRGFRANGQLWKPNTLADVQDSFALIDRDMLIAGVRLTYDARGEATRLRMTGPEAYDLKPEGDRRDKNGKAKGAAKSASGSTGKLDGTARPL